MEGTPWPRKLQGQLQGRVVGDMRLKMPPRCPRLGQPIQSLSTAIPLGALSITFLWLPGLTSLPAATPNAGHRAKLSGQPAGSLNNFIKVSIFWENISISVSQQPWKVSVCPQQGSSRWAQRERPPGHAPDPAWTLLRRRHAMNCPTFWAILLQSVPCPSTEKLVQAEFSGFGGTDMQQVKTTEGFCSLTCLITSYLCKTVPGNELTLLLCYVFLI